jgi:signal transduction histidine kinase
MKNRLRFLNSIRWRLPLSYAGIALLATLALGVLLLSTLRSYYDTQEREYLQNNANVMAQRLERLYHTDAPNEIIAAEVNNFAFLTHASVRLMSPDHAVVVHSENPVTFELSRVPIYVSDFNRAPNHTTEVGPTVWTEALPTDGAVEILQAGGGGDVAVSGIAAEGLPRNVSFTVGQGIWLDNGPFGYRLRLSEPPSMTLSDQIVTVAISDKREDIVFGYLELSEGPAFGDEIVSSVARQFVGAGIAAVVIAALMGWVVSRRISQPVLALNVVTGRMAEGDLSVRADTDRRDEIGMLSRSFNRMAQRIEKTVVTLRQFVADAAHELNTPITALQTNLELADSESNPQERRQYIQQAQAQLGRLETLTNSLLDLARLEATATLQFEPIDLSDVIRGVHERYASSAEQREIDLKVEFEGEAIPIEANVHQLIQVFENLLDNALKFTANGGKVTVRLGTRLDEVHVSIEDSGIGIPEEDLPRLFQRFHRGRNTAAYAGNGLGLVISKAIIEGHGGTIGAEACDEGTRFVICLPTNQSVKRSCQDASQSDSSHRG